MIERMLRQVFGLLLGLVVLSLLLGLVIGLVRQGGAVAATSIMHTVPKILADFVVTIIAGFFFVGLGVRAHQALTGRGGRAGRERDVHERQMRLTARRLAEGVPLMTAPELPADPDPAIAMEED